MRQSWGLSLLLGLCWLSPKAQGARVATAPQAVLRLEGGIYAPQLSSNSRYLAYTDAEGLSLRVLDLNSQDVVELSRGKVGPSFLWTPDGNRLFFRELLREGKNLNTHIKVFDATLQKISEIQTIEGSSGYLSFDPRSYKLYLVHEHGLYQQQLEYPTRTRPKWTQKPGLPYVVWIATQKAMLQLKDGGLTWETIPDDGSGVQSFAVSPDGQSLAWATEAKNLYMKQSADAKPILIGKGRDPAWHPYRSLLVYAAARMIGPKVFDYDLRVLDLKGQTRYLQQTPQLAERWPVWLDSDTILYTAEAATDLLRLRLTPEVPTPPPSAPIASAHEPKP